MSVCWAYTAASRKNYNNVVYYNDDDMTNKYETAVALHFICLSLSCAQLR